MPYELVPVYKVIETMENNEGKKEKNDSFPERYTRKEAKQVIKNQVEHILSNEIDGYYLDSNVKIDSYRWKIKKEYKIIWI